MIKLEIHSLRLVLGKDVEVQYRGVAGKDNDDFDIKILEHVVD
jgi:hypothetical protein